MMPVLNIEANTIETYKQPMWWQTDMLPEPLRHNSGHGGSHTFITHEFIDSLINNRRPMWMFMKHLLTLHLV